MGSLRFLEVAGEVAPEDKLCLGPALANAEKELSLAATRPSARGQAPQLPLAVVAALEGVVLSDMPAYNRAFAGFRLLRHWSSLRWDDTCLPARLRRGPEGWQGLSTALRLLDPATLATLAVAKLGFANLALTNVAPANLAPATLATLAVAKLAFANLALADLALEHVALTNFVVAHFAFENSAFAHLALALLDSANLALENRAPGTPNNAFFNFSCFTKSIRGGIGYIEAD